MEMKTRTNTDVSTGLTMEFVLENASPNYQAPIFWYMLESKMEAAFTYHISSSGYQVTQIGGPNNKATAYSGSEVVVELRNIKQISRLPDPYPSNCKSDWEDLPMAPLEYSDLQSNLIHGKNYYSKKVMKGTRQEL